MDRFDYAIMKSLKEEETDGFAENLRRAAKEREPMARVTFYKHLEKLKEEGLVVVARYGSARHYRISEPYPGFLEAMKCLEARIRDFRPELLKAEPEEILQRVVQEFILPSIYLITLCMTPIGTSFFGPIPKELNLRSTHASLNSWVSFFSRMLVHELGPFIKRMGEEPAAILGALRKSDPEIAKAIGLMEEGRKELKRISTVRLGPPASP